VDPLSGKIHRVEYRARQYPPPDVDRYEVKYVEKWQDGVHVESLSPSQLIARIRHWTYAPEPAIDVQVWRQLGTRNYRNYDVLMQWKQHEEDDLHLVEIRKYHMASTFDLIYDDQCIYRGHKQMLEMEEKHMNNWLVFRILQDINTYHDKLSPELQDWWAGFYPNTTEYTFAFTQYNYDRVCLALENLRYYYSQKGQKCPPSLAVDQCKQALDIFSRWLPRDPGLLPPALQPTPESPDMRPPADGEESEVEETKGDKKPRLLDRVRNWRLFKKEGNVRSLLLELEALGDDSLYKS
jgi:hypothetical protein